MDARLTFPRRSTAAVGCGSVFLAYALTSSGWSSADPWFALSYLLSLVAAFLLGWWLRGTEVIWVGYLILIAANVLLMSASYAAPDLLWLPYGVIGNPNYLGAAIAIALAGALAIRFYFFVPVALVGLWLTGSRGAMFAAGVCGLIHLWRDFRTTAFISLLGSIVIVGMVTQHSGNADWDRMLSIWARLGIWQDTLNHLTLWGHGWGSFPTAYASWGQWTNMTAMLAPHAYNDALELIHDLGLGAIPLWLLLVAVLSKPHPQRLVAWTFFALSTTYFPLYIPIVAHMFALTMGHMARTEETYNGSLETNPAALSARGW